MNNGSGQFRESTDSGLDRRPLPPRWPWPTWTVMGTWIYCANYIDDVYRGSYDEVCTGENQWPNARHKCQWPSDDRATAAKSIHHLSRRSTARTARGRRALPERWKGAFHSNPGSQRTFQDPSGKPVQALATGVWRYPFATSTKMAGPTFMCAATTQPQIVCG